MRDVVEAARRVVAMLPDAKLAEAGNLLEESATLWHHATEGGIDPAIDDVHGDYHCDTAKARGAFPERGAERAARIEQARRALPPPVEGARTLGAWIAPDGGKVDLSSGKGEYFTATLEFARARGLAPPKGIWTMARHLELQFAIRLRAAYDRDPDASIIETIAIDRPPCETRSPGEPSCDTLLPTFLPPGSVLTILVQDGTSYTYRGAKQ